MHNSLSLKRFNEGKAGRKVKVLHGCVPPSNPVPSSPIIIIIIVIITIIIMNLEAIRANMITLKEILTLYPQMCPTM